MNSRYVILIDPSKDSLLVQETALRYLYEGEVRTVSDVTTAKDLLRGGGKPELLVVDSVLMADSDQDFSMLLRTSGCNVLLKDEFVADFRRALDPIGEKRPKGNFFPVKVAVLQLVKKNPFDLYLKLSHCNFVKLFHAGEIISSKEIKKLKDKKITELYISNEDGPKFLRALEILFLKTPFPDEPLMVLNQIEELEKVARAMGWSPEVLRTAERSVRVAMKILSQNKKISQVLRRRLSEGGKSYSRHVSFLTYLSAALGASLEWVGETGQVKLALAALLHDLAVPENIFHELESWNQRARVKDDRSEEVIRYRMHPFDALKDLTSLSLPSDVDQIIVQHHEKKDGSGFPRGLVAHRIHPLASVFIMAEDLIGFIEEGPELETSVSKFLKWGKFYYDGGHFSKIFIALEKMLQD